MSTTVPHDTGGKSRLCVLVVDDQKDTARMLRLYIGNAGHSVHTAGTKAAALELAGRIPFDILVADVQLPDGSGYELLAELRARAPMKGIVFTGLSGLEEEARSRAAGFADFLLKPFDLDRLVDAIERIARTG